MLLFEIWLTVVAWRKGWRMYALLPLGIGMIVAFLVGMAVGASSGSIEHTAPVFFLLDLICLGVLIGMAIRKPQRVQSAEMPEVGVPAEVEASSVKA